MFDLLLIFVVGFVAVLTPGPDILLILRTAINAGPKEALVTLLGISSGHIFYLFILYIGVSALLTSAFSLMLINLFGGLYLLFIAISILRARPADIELDTRKTEGGYLRGFLINLSNPKAMLFFMVVLTPFLQEGSLLLQMSVLFLGMFLAFLSTIWAANYFKKKLLSAKISRTIDLAAAVIFIFFAGGMLLGAYEFWR